MIAVCLASQIVLIMRYLNAQLNGLSALQVKFE